jgi:hypothetical protein
VAAEYQEHFGEHAYDDEGNYIGPAIEHSEEAEAAWADLYEAPGGDAPPGEPAATDAPAENVLTDAPTDAPPADAPAADAPAEASGADADPEGSADPEAGPTQA